MIATAHWMAILCDVAEVLAAGEILEVGRVAFSLNEYSVFGALLSGQFVPEDLAFRKNLPQELAT